MVPGTAHPAPDSVRRFSTSTRWPAPASKCSMPTDRSNPSAGAVGSGGLAGAASRPAVPQLAHSPTLLRSISARVQKATLVIAPHRWRAAEKSGSASPLLPRKNDRPPALMIARRTVLHLLKKTGAGEGARTLDPDLGKVEMLRKGHLHSPASCIAAVNHRRHSWGMPARRPAETTPDLFSTLPTVTAAGPSVPKGKPGPDGLASQQRHFLPNDLAGALKRLDDVEIDALLAVSPPRPGVAVDGRPARRKRNQ